MPYKPAEENLELKWVVAPRSPNPMIIGKWVGGHGDCAQYLLRDFRGHQGIYGMRFLRWCVLFDDSSSALEFAGSEENMKRKRVRS